MANLGFASAGRRHGGGTAPSRPHESPAIRGTLSFPVLSGLVRVVDLALLLAGGAVLAALTGGRGAIHYDSLLLASVVGGVVVAASLAQAGAYRHEALLSLSTQLRLTMKPLALGVLCLIACLFVLHQENAIVRTWPLAWAGGTAVLLVLARAVETRLVRHWTLTNRLVRKVAVVGVNDFSQEFIRRLNEEPHAYRVVGLYDDRISRVPPAQEGVKVLGKVQDLLARSQSERIDVIVVALPLSAVDRISHILDQLGPAIADVCLTTDLAGARFARHQFEGLGGNAVVSIREAPLKDWRAIQKALLDYTAAVVATVLLSPILLLTALLIRLDSPGPILFRQPRLGFNNKLFTCYKFRSMHHGMTDLLADKQTTRGDPRVTRVGRIIRKLSIDEMPQLLNVLNGTMSMVGPRPHAPNTKAADRLFTEVVQQYARRHRVKPGITGWAQVNGWRGETTTLDQIEQRVACDLFYIENWSVRFDLRIMVMTVLREVFSRRAF